MIEDIDTWLRQSLDDRKVTRAERQELAEHSAGLSADNDREAIRRRAFEMAAGAIDDSAGREILDWLEDVVKALRDPAAAGQAVHSEVFFSPGEDCPAAIIRLFEDARKSVDICVFTITDDRISDAIVEAHRRGVRIRILTDDAKAEDLGSDIGRFEHVHIPVRVDRSPFHMHNKFAIFDGRTLLNGSYNWTRGAARDNAENLVITDDPRLIGPFQKTFDRLWDHLG